MAAPVITKILRGFLKNLPKGEATKLAREHGFVTEVSKLSDPRKKIHPAATRKSGEPRRPADEHEYLIEHQPDPRIRQTPEQVVTEEIDIKAWEKAGFPGVREYATERLGTSKQTQKRLELELKKRLGIGKFIGPPSPVDEVVRQSNIGKLATISHSQSQLINFGRSLSDPEIVKAAIKEGVYNPVEWEKAGLSRWPEDLRRVREMARIALDIDPSKALDKLSKRDQERIAIFAREIPGMATRQIGSDAETLAKTAKLAVLRKVRRRGTALPTGPVREVGVEDYGTKIYQQDDRALSDLTDEDIVRSGYQYRTDPSIETRDEFGRLLPEFKDWSDLHDTRKRELRIKEQESFKAGNIKEILPDEEMDEIVRTIIDRDPLYGRPFGSRFRIHVPFEGAERGQFLKIPQDVPPTKQDVTRLMRGEELPSESAKQKYDEVIGEEIATSRGTIPEDMPTLQDVLTTPATQERYLDKIFDQPTSGVARGEPRPHENTLARILQAQRQQAERDQFAAGRSAAIRGRLLGQGKRNEAFAYGEPTEVIPPRMAQQLGMPLLKEPTPEVVADLRKRAAEIRRAGNKFRTEANEKIRGSEFQTLPELRTEYRPKETGIGRYQPVGAKAMSDLPSSYRLPDVSPQERRDIWREIRSRPEYIQYKQDQAALKREIYNKAPDLMEFETYTRAQRTKTMPRESVPSLSRIKKASGKEKKLLESNRKIAINKNKFLDESDAVATGFIKKDGTPDIAAWKKAGSPEPIDWEDRLTDKLVEPKQKLVDSFKKGSKIVTRKRGGLIKKPRGWGAARYKCN